jgi:hypothetical protein
MRFLPKKNILVCVVGLGLAFPACAQSDPNDLRCLVEMELSPFGAANNVPQGADVDAEVTVGGDGRLAALVLTPKPPLPLALEIEYYLRDKAVYDPNCAGEKVKLRFSFRVEGKPTYNLFTRFRFRPPNHFIISTQIVLPHILRLPVSPNEEAEKPKP